MKNNKLLLSSVFLSLVLAFVPFSSQDVTYDNLGDLNVDVAYQLAMPFFLEEKLQFGKEVIFTYGPWAILHTATAPLKWFTLIILFRFLLLSSIIFSLVCFVESFDEHLTLKRITITGSVTILILWLSGAVESFYMFPSLAVAYSQFSNFNKTCSSCSKNKTLIFFNKNIWFFLSFISAWLALTKFSYFVVATIAFSFILLFNLIEHRFPIFPIVYIFTLLLAWLSAGQNLANLPTWLIMSLNLSDGYPDAMSKGFLSPYSIAQVFSYYVSSLVIIVLSFSQLMIEKKPAFLFSFLFTLAIVFISVKYAFGGNQIENSMVLLFVVLWFVMINYFREYCTLSYSSKARSYFIRSSLASLLVVILLSWLSTGVNFPFFSASFRLAMMRNNASELVSWILFKPTDYYSLSLARSYGLWKNSNNIVEEYIEKTESIPTESNATPTYKYTKSIDIYPQQTAMAMGLENLKYNPRPAFLSLNAHTRELALTNAQHLENNNSPDLIAFQVLPQEYSTNNRHPATADGPSWPLLLSNYKLSGACNSCEFLLLEKRDKPRTIIQENLINDSFKFQESIDMTEFNTGILWIETHFERTLFGNIVKILYKSPHIIVRLTTEDNRQYSFQVVPDLGDAGFIISPFINKNTDFSDLFDQLPKVSDRVKSIAFFSEASYIPVWNSNFTVNLSSLNILENGYLNLDAK